jgi:hypothetical protein
VACLELGRTRFGAQAKFSECAVDGVLEKVACALYERLRNHQSIVDGFAVLECEHSLRAADLTGQAWIARTLYGEKYIHCPKTHLFGMPSLCTMGTQEDVNQET